MKKTKSEKLSFLESFLNVSLSKDGYNASIWCPFCKHSNKNKLKLVIHLEKNFYHCWLCDKKGSNVSYLISRINKDKAEETKRYFVQKASKNNNLISDSLSNFFGLAEEVDEINDYVEIPDNFSLLVSEFNSKDPDIRDVFKYAIKRGASKNKFWFLRLGVSKSQDYKRCLILPSLDKYGKLNFFTARRIDATTKDGFKYKNASVQKKNIIFNEINIQWDKPLTIVEGPLDLLKTNDNATCLLGSSLTEDMLLFKEIIKNKTTINLALDADVYYKTLQIAKLLDSYNIDVNILDTRGYEDVGDMSFNEFNNILEKSKKYTNDDFLLRKIAML